MREIIWGNSDATCSPVPRNNGFPPPLAGGSIGRRRAPRQALACAYLNFTFTCYRRTVKANGTEATDNLEKKYLFVERKSIFINYKKFLIESILGKKGIK